MHLHRHSFELARIGGKPTAGAVKDVVLLGGFQEADVDFVADNPGPALFHCHQQLHMDFGLMALFNYGRFSTMLERSERHVPNPSAGRPWRPGWFCFS